VRVFNVRGREYLGGSVKCPRCGHDVQPSKVWHLTSPLPDAEGRVTITVMGSFKCPSCGYSWRGRVSVLKVGGGHEVEVGEGKRRPKERAPEPQGRGRVIEIDVNEVLSEEE